MTKKEKKEEALRLKAEIGARHGQPPKKEFTSEEKKLKKEHEVRMRDKAKNHSKKNILGSKNDKPSKYFDPWSKSW